MAKKNSMGSEVVEGFECKPKVLDKDKPVMFCAVHIFICDGERCNDPQSLQLAEKIRNIIEELGYDRGENRIKVTRTHCNGACRFKKFAYVYKNPEIRKFKPSNIYSAWKKVHEWTDNQWKEFIEYLINDEETLSFADYKVTDKVYYNNDKHI